MNSIKADCKKPFLKQILISTLEDKKKRKNRKERGKVSFEKKIFPQFLINCFIQIFKI